MSTPTGDSSATHDTRAGDAMLAALTGAGEESELISRFEGAAVVEAWQDVELGLMLVHTDPVARHLLQQLKPRTSPPPDATPSVEWTRAADMHMLADPNAEEFVHAAVSLFAATGRGKVFSMHDQDGYRLHVGKRRVRFAMHGACVRVLGVFASA